MWKQFPSWKERRAAGRPTPRCGLALCRIAGATGELSTVPGPTMSPFQGQDPCFNFYFGPCLEEGLLLSFPLHLCCLPLTESCPQIPETTSDKKKPSAKRLRPKGSTSVHLLPLVAPVSTAHLCRLAPSRPPEHRDACFFCEVVLRRVFLGSVWVTCRGLSTTLWLRQGAEL